MENNLHELQNCLLPSTGSKKRVRTVILNRMKWERCIVNITVNETQPYLKCDLKFCHQLSTRSLTSTQLSQNNSILCSNDILKMQVLITQKYPTSGLKVKATSLATAAIVTGDDVPLTSLFRNFGVVCTCICIYVAIKQDLIASSLPTIFTDSICETSGNFPSKIMGFQSFLPHSVPAMNIYIYKHTPLMCETLMLLGVGWMSLQAATLLKYIISYNPGYGLWK